MYVFIKNMTIIILFKNLFNVFKQQIVIKTVSWKFVYCDIIKIFLTKNIFVYTSASKLNKDK